MDERVLVILLIILAACYVGLLIYCIKSARQKKILQKSLNEQRYRYDYDMNKAEIQSLQSQINPHFLYNTLEVLRSEALINRDLKAAEMAESLANYFRYNISRRSDVVSLGEEMDNVNNYIRIQQMRFGERIGYQVIYHTEEAEARKAQIPKLSIQPLVENSIYHGLEKIAKGGIVRVHVTVTGARLIVQVTDNGIGMTPDVLARLQEHLANNVTMTNSQRKKNGGIALVNINRRIKMIYGGEYGLSFSAAPDMGTEAEVTIPYIAG